MGMLLHGIFASSALDSTSEILDIKGLDVSSLAVANYEHESKIPGQVCGKVLKSVKIFKPEDCENPEQLMFWNRIKIPFLYGVIELFDDVGHSGALDVAAMALYDQNNKDKYDFKKTFPLIGFSIEGSKINKEQNVITHSLARKVSLTITPANKTCWGEIYQETQNQKPAAINKRDSIAKAKDILSKILKSEQISAEQQVLIKHDIQDLENLEKNELEKAVHFPTTTPGVSDMGIEARRGDIKKPGVVAHGYGRVTKPEIHLGRAKAIAQKQLESIRQEPKPNLPKSEKDMEKSTALERHLKAKGKSKWQARAKRSAGIPKGVHTPNKPKSGTSEAGDFAVGRAVPARSYDFSPDRQAGKEKARSLHQQKLTELRSMPKPNLPKSEELIGGKGDNKSLSSFNNKQVKMGRTVEMEHTKSPKIAQEITADHLTEDPDYYSKLKDAGLADELEKASHPVWSSRRAAPSIQKKEDSKPKWSSRRAVNSMQKALTATASPLNPEILEPKMQRITKSENIFDDLQKGEKELKAMYGANLQPHHEAFVKWATKSLPNQNWQEWAVKNHRENPKQFTPKVTKQLEHFGGSKHIPDIANVRLGNHNLKDGIQAFKDAEDSYNAKAISKPQIIKPSPKTEKIMDFGDGYAWFSLNKPACEKEGAAMGHCGNVPSKKRGQNVLSLRKIVNIGGKEYHEPAATFIKEPNSNEIGEMKGRANTVPSPKYHKYIKSLFEKTDLVPKGGGYLPGNNFHLDDLSHEDHDDLLSKRPDLAKYSNRINNNDDISKLSIKQKYDIASNPNLDPKHHEKLVNNDDNYVRAAIARNPNLDPKHHEKLVNDDNYVRAAIARNPNLDPKHHEKLVNDDNYVRRAIASNPNLDPKHHEKLVNDDDDYVRRVIAENPNLDPKHHEKLVNDDDNYVRAAIASNPNLDPKHHEKLVNDDNYVRRAIAENPNLDPKHHEKLVNDDDDYVRRAIAEYYFKNPNRTKQEKEVFLNKIKNNELKERVLAEAKLQKLKEESDKNIAKRSERVKEYRNKITKSENIFKSEPLDAAIPTWNLVEKFKDFLKERVPSLTDKEAGAFTRAFKIFKIKAAEKKLKDL